MSKRIKVVKRIISFLLFTSIVLGGCVTHTQKEMRFNRVEASKARLELALGYLNVKDFTQSKRNLDKALAYTPNDAMVLAVYAYFYQVQGRDKDADIFYQKALKQQTNHKGEIQHNYGIFLCQIGRYSEAFKQFEQALDQPNYYHQKEAYQNIILCAKQAGQPQMAEKYQQRLNYM